MSNFKWEFLLKEFNQKLLLQLDEETKETLDSDLISSGYFGYSGATEVEIKAVEDRIGTSLPSSYRDFLKVSNGWYQSDWSGLELYGTKDIDWLCVNNQDIIESWMSTVKEIPSVSNEDYFVYGEKQDCVNFRCEYLQTALQISNEADEGDIFLLIPEVINNNGEWEAWHLGAKLPGADRYLSFYDLMLKVAEQGCFIY